MTNRKNLLAFIFGLLLTLNASAATLWVYQSSPDPTPPYSDILSAAHTIQDAIAASTNGDLILVMDGVYDTGSYFTGLGYCRLLITNAVTVRSLYGPAVTIIRGDQVPGTTNGPGAMRCVYLGSGATLSGFTLTGGATIGGTGFNGGGVLCQASSSVVSNCVISGNWSGQDGGGVAGGTMYNCLLTGNVSTWNGGGAISSTLKNCLVSSNYARAGGGASGGSLYNCTVAYNTATTAAGGTAQSGLYNSIIYYNTAPSNPNYTEPLMAMLLFYCCTTPYPSFSLGFFTNAPLFVNPAAGNFHLQANSPCINAGNNGLMTNRFDLDQNPRISGDTVDVGAYELQNPASRLSYVWAQNHGFPTDGSADLLDPDGDGANNYCECISGTSGTNAASVLKLATPVLNAGGLTLSWSGVSRKVYYIERSSSLSVPWGFEIIRSNIASPYNGQVTLSFPEPANSGPYFYRIGVHQDR